MYVYTYVYIKCLVPLLHMFFRDSLLDHRIFLVFAAILPSLVCFLIFMHALHTSICLFSDEVRSYTSDSNIQYLQILTSQVHR